MPRAVVFAPHFIGQEPEKGSVGSLGPGAYEGLRVSLRRKRQRDYSKPVKVTEQMVWNEKRQRFDWREVRRYSYRRDEYDPILVKVTGLYSVYCGQGWEPGSRQSRDSSRLSDDPTSWSGTTRLRWSRPGARFKRQAWSDIWCRPRLCRGPDQPPRYARSIVAMSIFFICSMACMARWDLSGSGSLIISFMGVGMICQDTPYLSFSQPQTPSSPPSLSRCQ